MRNGLIAVALVACGSASAMDLPRYDVESICAANERAYGSPAQGCMFLNQRAYDELKTTWPNLSEWVQGHALAQCQASGPRPDYQHLAGCVTAWSNRERQDQENEAITGTHHFQP